MPSLSVLSVSRSKSGMLWRSGLEVCLVKKSNSCGVVQLPVFEGFTCDPMVDWSLALDLAICRYCGGQLCDLPEPYYGLACVLSARRIKQVQRARSAQ